MLSLENQIELDLTLARSDYYTVPLLRKAVDVEIGSISGGGRYDNLTGIFGLPDVSGVGISFGADRIYDVLNQLDLYPENLTQGTDILFANFGEQEENIILPLLTLLRSRGISAEIYPEPAKLKKQLSYANVNNIPFVALIGENEISEGKITLKNMKSGEQKKLSREEFMNELSTKNRQQ